MQVTPSNALFAALSAQIQSLQQNQTQHSKHAARQSGGDKSSHESRAVGHGTPGSATVLDSNGQVDLSGATPNLNLREAPSAGRHSGQSFTAPGSLVDITV